MLSATISALAMSLAAVVCGQLGPAMWWAMRNGTPTTLERDALILSGALLWIAAFMVSTVRFLGCVLPDSYPPSWIPDGIMVTVIAASLALIISRRMRP